MIIDSHVFKTNVVRTSVWKLSKAGFQFTVSEKGLVGKSIVTRIK